MNQVPHTTPMCITSQAHELLLSGFINS